jgi:hypothetical protein
MAARLANPYNAYARMKTLLQDPDLICGVDKLLKEVEQQIAGKLLVPRALRSKM